MKTSVKIALIVLSGCTLLSFMPPKPITVDSIRDKFLLSLFLTDAESEKPVTIKLKSEWDEDSVTYYANPYCGNSPAMISYAFYEGLDTTWSYYSPDIVARFKTLFGQEIIKSKVKLPGKDWEGNPIYWNQFNGLAIKTAFDKLYQKPMENFHGTGLKKIYDASLKNYVRDVTNIVIKVLSNKPAFEALAKQYMTKATTDPEFYGPSFGDEASTKLGANLKQECVVDYSASRVVGTMLRRQCDGSLPVLLVCLKTVLKDYDPEYYNKVALKF